jgi:CBS-domain-containing membrane protein
MSTPVFDVVHEFSGRGISAVPIIDEEGIVVNLYETVDVIVRHVLRRTNDHDVLTLLAHFVHSTWQTLVRLGAYQSLDLTIAQALNERSPDFPGVVICTASDSLGTLLQLINKRRVHRLVVVEGEEDEKRGGRKGRLLGIITLTDVLRYLVGTAPLHEHTEPPEGKPHLPPQPQENPQQGQSQQESGTTNEA